MSRERLRSIGVNLRYSRRGQTGDKGHRVDSCKQLKQQPPVLLTPPSNVNSLTLQSDSHNFRFLILIRSFLENGVVDGDGDEVGRCWFEEGAEAELRRNDRMGDGEEVELGKDAFILPTGNYPNNTCISSTPVAHQLSSEGNEG
ncbi:hypothetical protein ALC57_00963 [Trachymyrmex cornetzi]|uniref:Uncharacterized protein n=1 Tax=Trachymyrmex cornetzi TaxID=471704 RepID=A0A195EN50_9HYME|nr:hypothetical protein ALC57_00963 [Trachymyrmex cornetzi]